MHQSIKVTFMPVIRAVSPAYRQIQCKSYRIWVVLRTTPANRIFDHPAATAGQPGRGKRYGSRWRRERTKPELLTSLSSVSGKASPSNCELHFITNLLLQPRLSLRLLTHTCIK